MSSNQTPTGNLFPSLERKTPQAQPSLGLDPKMFDFLRSSKPNNPDASSSSNAKQPNPFQNPFQSPGTTNPVTPSPNAPQPHNLQNRRFNTPRKPQGSKPSQSASQLPESSGASGAPAKPNEGQIASLGGQLAEKNRELQVAKNVIEALRRRNGQQAKDQQAGEENKGILERELERLNKDHQAVCDGNGRLEDVQTQKDEALKAMEAEFQTAKSELEAMRAQFEAIMDEKEELKRVQRQVDAASSAREAEMENIRRELEQTKATSSAMKAEMEDTKRELEQTNATASAREAEMEETKRDLKQTKTALEAMEADLQKAKSEGEVMRKRSQTVDDENENLRRVQKELHEASRVIEGLEHDKVESEETVVGLSEVLEASQATAAEKERELRSSKTLNDDLTRVLAEKDVTIAKMEQTRKTQGGQAIGLEKKMGKMKVAQKEEINAFQEREAKLERTIKELEALQETRTRSMEITNEELQDALTNISSLEEAEIQWRESTIGLEEDLTRVKGAMEEKEGALKEAMEGLKAMKEERKSMRQRIIDLEEELRLQTERAGDTTDDDATSQDMQPMSHALNPEDFSTDNEEAEDDNDDAGDPTTTIAGALEDDAPTPITPPQNTPVAVIEPSGGSWYLRLKQPGFVSLGAGFLVILLVFFLLYTWWQCAEAISERSIWMGSNSRAFRLDNEILRRQTIAVLRASGGHVQGWMTPPKVEKLFNALFSAPYIPPTPTLAIFSPPAAVGNPLPMAGPTFGW